jgi:hypothetical protein
MTDRSFTGQTQDVVAGSTGVYDFLFRQQASSQGAGGCRPTLQGSGLSIPATRRPGTAMPTSPTTR